MPRFAQRLLTCLALSFLLAACSTPPQPLTSAEIGAVERTELGADEALVVVRLNFIAKPIVGGWAHFHHDGPEKVRSGVLKRDVGDWTPMFSVPTEWSDRTLLFKVKAGWLSFDHYQSGLSNTHFSKPLRAYAKPRSVTYIGDLWLAETSERIQYQATDEAATVEDLRRRHPSLVARYAPVTDVLRFSP